MKPLIPWFEAPILEIPLGNFTLPLHGFGFLVALGFIFGGRAAMGRAKRLGLDDVQEIARRESIGGRHDVCLAPADELLAGVDRHRSSHQRRRQPANR